MQQTDESYEHTQPMDVAENAPKQSKRWMLTAWVDKLPYAWVPEHLSFPKFKAEYMCWGLEKCPTTNREHWHIYFRLNRSCRFEQLKRMLPETVHIEGACGTEEQCRNYCWSQGDHCDKSTWRLLMGDVGEYKEGAGKKGKRTDLEEIARKIAWGSTIKEIAAEHSASFIRYHNGIEAYARQIQPLPPIAREVQVIVLYGPTGTGKTHRALVSYPDAYVVLPGKNPWDEYSGQAVILFDEFRSDDWSITMMNKYLDKWRMTLQCRYRNSYAQWTLVIICTNDAPAQFYQTEPNPTMKAAFFRRIATSCHYVEKREDYGGPTLNEIMNSPPDTTF